MLDELQRLREVPDLLRLLAHYARAGTADREAWQDRLMELEGESPAALVKLHGDLIAFGWVEQNTGIVPLIRPGAVAGCYRITPSGLRACEQAKPEHEEDPPVSTCAEEQGEAPRKGRARSRFRQAEPVAGS
jgi:hypothetical protein